MSLGAILDYWKEHFKSKASAEILNTDSNGWLNEVALKEIFDAAYGEKFTTIFNCPSDSINDRFGFTSWGHFFTRIFNKGLRPISGE